MIICPLFSFGTLKGPIPLLHVWSSYISALTDMFSKFFSFIFHAVATKANIAFRAPTSCKHGNKRSGRITRRTQRRGKKGGISILNSSLFSLFLMYIKHSGCSHCQMGGCFFVGVVGAHMKILQEEIRSLYMCYNWSLLAQNVLGCWSWVLQRNCWSTGIFPTQPSLGFKEDALKNRKSPVSLILWVEMPRWSQHDANCWCGGTGDAYHGWEADKSAAAV